MPSPNDEYQVYPKGQISYGPGGLLRQVTNVTVMYTRNRKNVHTLASSPSGYSNGLRELSGTFSIVVPKSGFERDYFADLDNDVANQARLSIPGTNIVFLCVLSQAQITAPTDGEVQFQVDWIGKKQSVVKASTT